MSESQKAELLSMAESLVLQKFADLIDKGNCDPKLIIAAIDELAAAIRHINELT